jgi:malonate-semialdehyde dehydrogenase (acetylating)/methylmalonate-semialdehyde dehydrogenase
MPDANIDKAMPSLITSFFGCAGQRCLSGSILAPVGDIAGEVKEKFIAAAKAMKVGSGLDETVAMGPVGSAAHKEKIIGFINKGVEEGAELLLDGRDFTVSELPNGCFVGPTIFDKVKPEMTICSQEIFGPVVSIVNPKNLDEVVELVNTRNYANASCIYTQSGAVAREFKYRVNPSMIGVNIGIAAPMSFFPFGGYGNSFFGDIKGHGREIFQFYTDMKVVIERWF